MKRVPAWYSKPYGKDPAAWDLAVQQCRDLLLEWARVGRVGTYSEVVDGVSALHWPDGATRITDLRSATFSGTCRSMSGWRVGRSFRPLSSRHKKGIRVKASTTSPESSANCHRTPRRQSWSTGKRKFGGAMSFGPRADASIRDVTAEWLSVPNAAVKVWSWSSDWRTTLGASAVRIAITSGFGGCPSRNQSRRCRLLGQEIHRR